MLLKEIIDSIESVAPLQYQEPWDNSGLQIGVLHRDISSVLLAIDVTEAVLDEAISRSCNLIVSHHPLFFHGVKSLTGQTAQQRIIVRAIEHEIAIYSSHTAMDVAPNGVSWRMAHMLGLQNCSVLVPNSVNPKYGLGVLGELPIPISGTGLLSHVKTTFSAPILRYTNPPKQTLQRIAICGGAGADLLEAAIRAGADAYLSADFKYHELQDAIGQIMAIDIDHWISEQFTRDIFAEILQHKVPTHIAQTDCTHVHIFE